MVKPTYDYLCDEVYMHRHDALDIIGTFDYIDFNTSYTDGNVEGRLSWNTDDGTLQVGLPGGKVTGQILQEMLFRTFNDEGSIIPNGKPVLVNGASGNRLTVRTPDATSAGDTFATIALATEDLSVAQGGYVTTVGFVRGDTDQPVDTSGFAEGGQVFLGDDGNISPTPATKPNRTVFLGIVKKVHATEGEIWVNIIHLPMLYELSDVSISSVADLDLLQYQAGTGLWENKSLAEVADGRYLKLDQTTPQTVINGAPIFDAGIKVGDFLTVSDDGTNTNFDLTSGSFIWNISSIDEMKLTTTGLGIGVTPARKLHVHEPDTTSVYFALTHQGTGLTALDGFQFVQSGNDTYLINREDGDMYFRTNNINRLRIRRTGDIYMSTDNQKFYQGAGDNFSQYFDGTNQNFDLTTSGDFLFNNGQVIVEQPSTAWSYSPDDAGLIVKNPFSATSTLRSQSGISIQAEGYSPRAGAVVDMKALMRLDPQINDNPSIYFRIDRNGDNRRVFGVDYYGYFLEPIRRAEYMPGPTPTEGVAIVAGGGATASLPEQYSLYYEMRGDVWNTTTASSNEVTFRTYAETFSSAVPTARQSWYGGVNTNNPTTRLMSLDDSGNLYLPNDSAYHYWGAGNDVSLGYDGTDFNLITDLQNPSDFVVDCGTDKTLELAETVWEDINIGGVNLTLAAANRPDLITLNSSNVLTYAFDGNASTEELHGSFELAHDYKEGTNLKPHAHFYVTTAGTGNIKINLEYYIVDGETGNTITTGTLSDTVATTGTAWNQLFFDFGDITGTALKIGAQVHFRIYRDPTDAADTYTSDVAIGTFGIHYEVNTMGSRQITTK